MSDYWTNSELNACVSTYLWMLRAEVSGYRPIKKRVREALLRGPLSDRSHGAIEYRFQNISAVRVDRNEAWIDGYKPAKNVGSETIAKIAHMIESYDTKRDLRRLNWLVSDIPTSTIKMAVTELAEGKEFPYPDSVDYDIIHRNASIPPKKAIGYAGFLEYGAPLFSENFSGGEETLCFKKLQAAGFEFNKKFDSDDILADRSTFRRRVSQFKRTSTTAPPQGNVEPSSRIVQSKAYDRDPKVVGFVEERAAGICELCDQEAPFLRSDGTPFLEVHHIIPLAENGADIVENAAALCPNCHRACHYGREADQLRENLRLKISN